MGPRVASTRLIGAALAVLCGLSASSSLAGGGTLGEAGPVRQWVALAGGAVGALIGSQFELNPTIPPASGPRTRVKLLPRRGGLGIAVSHSF